MGTLPVTAEGQITLSKEMLEHLGVRLGDRITVEMLPRGILEMRAAGQAGQISEVFGLPKNKRREALSIDEIKDATARGWAKREKPTDQ
ncbi:MAG TPA: AbrB/MazE/SpoVT family DNA-binding domain-containing protein [Stellaceae bacterium]|jgi:antitoxin PrlF|nr:AbrB/MazE/SpoVT family DNA-binding domain-containing protein [Stellaceae bacterium]